MITVIIVMIRYFSMYTIDSADPKYTVRILCSCGHKITYVQKLPLTFWLNSQSTILVTAPLVVYISIPFICTSDNAVHDFVLYLIAKLSF
jgi:hypothetical protein